MRIFCGKFLSEANELVRVKQRWTHHLRRRLKVWAYSDNSIAQKRDSSPTQFLWARWRRSNTAPPLCLTASVFILTQSGGARGRIIGTCRILIIPQCHYPLNTFSENFPPRISDKTIPQRSLHEKTEDQFRRIFSRTRRLLYGVQR